MDESFPTALVEVVVPLPRPEPLPRPQQHFEEAWPWGRNLVLRRVPHLDDPTFRLHPRLALRPPLFAPLLPSREAWREVEVPDARPKEVLRVAPEVADPPRQEYPRLPFQVVVLPRPPASLVARPVALVE